MTTAYTSLLGLALPVTGELQGTWGDVVNNSITSLLDNAVAGTTTLSTDADVTLTTTTGASNQARQAILLCSGARTGIKNITAPASSKAYIVINATTGGYAVVVRGAGPTTGVTVSNGEKCLIAWNGSDFVKVSSTISNAGGSNTQVQYNSGGVLAGNSNFVFDGTNVGIGTAGPSGNLQVTAANARVRFSNTAGTASTLLFGADSGSVFLGAETNAPIYFITNNTEKVRIDTSGNLLVGTTTARNILTVTGPNAAAPTLGTASGTALFCPAGTTYGTMIGSSAGGQGWIQQQRVDTTATAYDLWLQPSGGNVGVGTTSPSAKLDIGSGNLNFSGTGQRITGDFTNATIANRLFFQTSTANSTTGVNFVPSGTGTRSAIGVWAGSDTANSSFCIFETTASQSAGLNSSKAGTGTTLPIVFSIDSSVQLQLNTNGTMSSADNAAAVGYKGTPLNEQSAAYTLVLTDQGKSIVHPASDNNARTFTIPANGTVAFPVGTTITFINMINTVTIAITTDTMYLAGSGSTGSRTLAAYGMATAVKLTSTTWIISGNGLT